MRDANPRKTFNNNFQASGCCIIEIRGTYLHSDIHVFFVNRIFSRGDFKKLKYVGGA
jgi:hypothetical protein